MYARNENEKQFLISGIPELGEVVVDFKEFGGVGEGWSFGCGEKRTLY